MRVELVSEVFFWWVGGWRKDEVEEKKHREKERGTGEWRDMSESLV